MVDLNGIYYCLEIQKNQVWQDQTIYLNQSKYIGSVMRQFGMELKVCMNPLYDQLQTFKRCRSSKFKKFGSNVGYFVSKWYWKFHVHAMVCIRPNIAHALEVVSQFMVNHGQTHWIAMKMDLCYLKGTMDFGLCFRKNIKDVVMGKVHSNEDVNHS